VTEQSADLSGAIEVWSAVLLGNLEINQAIFLEQLKTNNSNKIVDLFPKGRTSFYDYF
jgi:hypothetical protein